MSRRDLREAAVELSDEGIKALSRQVEASRAEAGKPPRMKVGRGLRTTPGAPIGKVAKQRPRGPGGFSQLARQESAGHASEVHEARKRKAALKLAAGDHELPGKKVRGAANKADKAGKVGKAGKLGRAIEALGGVEHVHLGGTAGYASRGPRKDERRTTVRSRGQGRGAQKGARGKSGGRKAGKGKGKGALR